MGKRILWDLDESIILLDGLISVRTGKKSRDDAVDLISSTLRKRAIIRGIEIDDEFRNKNGISMQMAIMEYIFSNGKDGWKKSVLPRLFQIAVNLYRNDKKEFYKKLNKAKKEIDNFNFELNANNYVVETEDSPSPSIENGRIQTILEEYFASSGLQVKSAIAYARLRNYYNARYKESLSYSDEEITIAITQLGILRGNRVFPKQNNEQEELMDEIIGCLRNAFDNKISGIGFEEVFHRFEKKLANTCYIFNKDTFKQAITTYHAFSYDYDEKTILNSEITYDYKRDLLNVIEGYYTPWTFDRIISDAWYIPSTNIKKFINRESTIVKVAPETYFYAPNLPITEEEITRLIKTLNRELEIKSYIRDNRLIEILKNEFPNFSINTENFTTYGLRNSLKYHLGKYFNFNGPVITKKGIKLNTADLYSEYASSYEYLTVHDLVAFSEELNTSIYWDAILSKMVRVSPDELIRKDMINFDIDKIDSVLDKLCPNDYAPLADIDLFLSFPNIGYPWNSYVLESYLYNSSNKFKLVHSSFSKTGVFGAIVRKNSLYDDYRTLLVDVLSKSDALNSATSALAFIVQQGYQQRKRLDEIDQVIQEAKLKKRNGVV